VPRLNSGIFKLEGIDWTALITVNVRSPEDVVVRKMLVVEKVQGISSDALGVIQLKTALKGRWDVFKSKGQITLTMSGSLGASRSLNMLGRVAKTFVCPQCHLPRPPPRYMLRIRTITSISHTTDPTAVPSPLPYPQYRAHPRSKKEIAGARRSEPLRPPPAEPPLQTPQPSTLALPPKKTSPLAPVSQAIDAEPDRSIQELLPLLVAQPPHYITIHVHGRPFFVTQGDRITLPFLLHGVQPGDTLRLNRASLLGSRDYTLKSPSLMRRTKDEAALGLNARRERWIDERLFLCRATVLGEEMEPERVKEKKKQRNRRVKTVVSQHRYTVLRISELQVFGPEVLGGNAQIEER
jgi:large subunit ribosomal protein L21